MTQFARSPVAIIVLVLLATLAGGCGGGDGGSATRPATGKPPPAPDPPPAPIQGVFEPVPTYESDYEALFSLDSMKTIHIRISEEEWNGLLNDVDHNIRAEVSRRADFFFGDFSNDRYKPAVLDDMLQYASVPAR